MTNEQKFRTSEERVRAFNRKCGPCEVVNCDRIKAIDCYNKWLDLPCEEEKPMPCPFCGGKMGEGQSSDLRRVLICENKMCGYITPKMNTTADAIAAHNRVCRAVEEYRKGESK